MGRLGSDLDIRKGVNALPRSLTINGVTVAPSFAYKGNDANASAWVAEVGPALALTGSGTDPTLNQDLGLADASQGVLFNDGKYFQAVNDAANVALEDFVFELIYKATQSSAQENIFDARSTGGGNGWAPFAKHEGAGGIQLGVFVQGPSGSISVNSATGLANATPLHAMWFFDRSGSAQCYVNSAASGSATAISTHGSYNNANPTVTIGSRYDGSASLLNNSTVAWLAMWKRTDWLDTHLQAAVALQRYRMLGI